MATRSVLVPTARTARRSKSRSRSPKRFRHASARSCEASSSRLSSVEPGAEPHRLAQGIQGIDLVADDADDLAVEAVRAEIDRGERGIFGIGRVAPT